MNQIDLQNSIELVHSHKYREALNLLESIRKTNTSIIGKSILARLDYLTAICLHKLNLDYKRALEYYNISLENGFNEFWVRYHRGLLYLQLGELDFAIDDLSRAVELEPDNKDTVTILKDLTSGIENNSIPRPKLSSPVIVLSVPKSGTMLLTNVLSEIFGEDQVIPSKIFNIGLINENYIRAIPELKNKIYVGHLHYSDDLAKKLSRFPKIILLRDPRDQVVSLAHFVDKMKTDYFGYEENFWNNLETFENKISAAILGMICKEPNHQLTSVYDTYINYCLKWIDPFSIVIRYEDIIGSQFGGNDSVTFSTISRVMNHLGIPIDEKTLNGYIEAGSKPTKSPTFRSGEIHAWKDEFNESHVIQMKTAASNLVSALGFELNENWNLESENHNVQHHIDEQSIKNLHSITDIYNKYDILQNFVKDNTRLQYLIDGWAFRNLVEHGDYENAIPIIRRLLKLLPDHPALNYFHGFCLHTINKDFKNAINYYNTALENGFGEFWVRYNRGTVHIELGELDFAIDDLSRAVELEPDNKDAKSILEWAKSQKDNTVLNQA